MLQNSQQKTVEEALLRK